MQLILHTLSFQTDDNFDLYARLHREYVQAAILAADSFQETLPSCKNMDILWTRFNDKLALGLQKFSEFSCKKLFDCGIYDVSEEQFFLKYSQQYMDVDQHIEPILEKFSQISEVKAAFQERQALKRASRGYWQGGGFGVVGAIKGALTASAMNAVGDIFHGFGSFVSESFHESKIERMKSEIFQDAHTRPILSNAIVNCCLGSFWGLISELHDHGFVSSIELKPNEGNIVYTNALRYANDDAQLLDLLARSILLNPFNPKPYHTLYTKFPNATGLSAFSNYVGMDSLCKFQRLQKHNAEAGEILLWSERSIDDKCKKLSALYEYSVKESANLDVVISELLERLYQQCTSGSIKIETAIETIKKNCAGCPPEQIDILLKKLDAHMVALAEKKDRQRINELTEYSTKDYIKKMETWVTHGKEYAINVDEEIILLVKKATKAYDCEDLLTLKKFLDANYHEKSNKIQEVVLAIEHKIDLYKQENQSGFGGVYIFSPILFDVINTARKGNPASQLWLIKSLCPDCILKNGTCENGTHISISEQTAQRISDIILYFFDKPHIYSFDFYMRLRLMLMYDSTASYCKKLTTLVNRDDCPAALYDLGRYAITLTSKNSLSFLTLIEHAALQGYHPAIQYMKSYLDSNTVASKHSSLFYEILGSTFYYRNYHALYTTSYKTDDTVNALIQRINILYFCVHGNLSFKVYGIQPLTSLLQQLWDTYFRKHYIIGFADVSFYTSQQSQKNCLKYAKQACLSLQNELPLYVYFEKKTHGYQHKTTEIVAQILTTKGAYLCSEGKSNFIPFSLSREPNISENKKLFPNDFFAQAFYLIQYVLAPYSSHMNEHMLSKLSMCGNPYAISRLSATTNISKEKRDILISARKQWEKAGKYYAVCPNCFQQRTVEDIFCPDCGAKIH